MAQAAGKTVAIKNENFLQYKTWKISEKWARQAQLLNLNKDYINFVSQGAKEVFSSPNLDPYLRSIFLEDIQFPGRGRVAFRTLNVRHANIRVINYPFMDKAVGRYLIQVGVPQDPLMQQLRNWLYSIAISVPLILLLTNFVGRMLANRILQPVYEITDLAKRITQEDLSARIKTKHFDREMGTLIESFNEMIARLEKSFSHIEQFSYHVAHELKTPLTIIQGEAELILRKDRSVEEYKKSFEITLGESKRMFKTVEDLLLLAKLEYQPELFKFESFDFCEFFADISGQADILSLKKNIQIDTSLPQGPVEIYGDLLHLRRLFLNLIDNAIKFTPEGGRIHIKVTCEDQKVITLITDTGRGISAEHLARIFEKFFSIDKSTRGTGLGLNIVQTIVKLHEGDIKVESKINQGTTFRVVLPQHLNLDRSS